jgi:hypothetical protein
MPKFNNKAAEDIVAVLTDKLRASELKPEPLRRV